MVQQAQVIIDRDIRRLIAAAFTEDAPQGDITSRYFGEEKAIVTARLISKATGVIAGLSIAEACFKYVNRRIVFSRKIQDGTLVKSGDILAEITGPKNSVLLGERTALNFLQHLSGVATATQSLVRVLEGTKAVLLDTRKTIPGLRRLDKYAVTCGGGRNHRMSLSDMILIKDNHLAKLSFTELQKRIALVKKKQPMMKIEVEAETLGQVRRFFTVPVDVIMLDNMPVAQMKTAVALRNKMHSPILFEASGNVTERTILKIARCGVDYISVGAITHSVKAFDISLRMAS
jgi:nicotinate-nucleotide pyrophosphorylase (carboxylating)